MGFFDFIGDIVSQVVDPLAPLVADVAASGALTGVSPALLGPGGIAGAAGVAGRVAEGAAGGAVLNALVGGGGGTVKKIMAGPGVGAAARSASGKFLMNLLAVNGIHPAPNANIKATVVILLTPEGAVVDSVRRGTPKIMSRDLQIAKKVAKTVGKLHSKLPRRTVQPSLVSEINQSIKRKILRDVNGQFLRLPPGQDCG